jgi:hypothetical protein
MAHTVSHTRQVRHQRASNAIQRRVTSACGDAGRAGVAWAAMLAVTIYILYTDIGHVCSVTGLLEA